MLPLVLALQAAAPTADLTTLRPQNPASSELRAAIEAADAEHFRLMWQACEDPAKQERFLHPDGEFYHDRSGASPYAPGTLEAQKRRCEQLARNPGASTRRELVPGTFTVDPIPGFGAFSTGEHRFYIKRPGGMEQLTAVGRFAILWKQDGNDWKVYRSISYDHRSPVRKK